MKKSILSIAVLLICLTIHFQLFAQPVKEELTQLMRDDSTDMNTIALYSQNVRENIFKVSAHPEGVVKLNDAQKKSNTSFKNLLSGYSKEEQQKIWNLTRYNDLIAQLATAKGKKSKTEKVLEKFPAEIHDDAYEYGIHHNDLILAIDKVNKDFNSECQTILMSYSADDQAAFRDMLNTPEALNLLNNNMHMTVHLGDIYKNNPAMLRQEFDSLNVVLAEQNAREKEEWKQEMNQNPDAQDEMKQSADEYAKDNGYSEKDNIYDPNVVEHYVFVPYPYWSGYPWWYEYNYWYPYPYWYHCGYYHWRGGIVWYGPPSPYFIHWHFNHHQHFYSYPHLTNVYLNHYYYGPRTGMSVRTVEVHKWMSRNENSFPRDFRSDNGQRVDRIREYGKSEVDRDQYNRNNPGKNVTRDDYMKQHTEEYPHLKQPVVVEQPTTPNVTPREEKSKDRPNVQPGKDQPKPNPAPRTNERPKVTPAPQNEQPKPNPAPRTNERPKVTPAPRNEQPKPNPAPRANDHPKPSPAPNPKMQPNPRPVTPRNSPVGPRQNPLPHK